jgi:ethanolamine utilization protein EutN
MIIARVVDNVVASQKHESHFGKIILLVQPLDLAGREVGDAIVALDAVSAGIGDRVLVVQEGFAAMTSVDRPNSPIDASVIGIVDEIDVFDSGNAE